MALLMTSRTSMMIVMMVKILFDALSVLFRETGPIANQEGFFGLAGLKNYFL